MPYRFISFLDGFGQTCPVLELFEIYEIRGPIINERLCLSSDDVWVVNKHGGMGRGDDHGNSLRKQL
jgi:hypothetical protein